MDTKPITDCKSCGTQLVQNSDSLAAGLCPCCLLADSLHSTIADLPASTPPPPLEEVSSAFPDLEIIELIGQGAMGAVYKARQKSLDRMVALKLLPKSLAADPEFAKRFEVEAKALATLNHPNIVTVHDFGKRVDLCFLMMEFVDGPNLRELINDHQLSHAEALTIIPPLCEALEFAHGHNIVHCDIKPENLLLDTKGRVKVADFGIAKILDQTITVIDSDKVAGTPAYMAPEQKNDPLAVDARADIYSLGVVFYEMLTGERPSNDLTPPSGKNSSLDVSLDEVVLRALEANPNLRWQSANALNTELQTILSKKLGEPKVTPPKNLPKSTRKRALLSCVLAIIGSLLLPVGYALTTYRSPMSEVEHQTKIDRIFQFKVEISDLKREETKIRSKIWEKRKHSKEPSRVDQSQLDRIRKDQSSIFTSSEYRDLTSDGLTGVRSPAVNKSFMILTWISFSVIGLAAFYLGRRHLSWLRGQKDPLPGLWQGMGGVLLCLLSLFYYGIFEFADEYTNWKGDFMEASILCFLGIIIGLIVSVLVVRGLLVWVRNHTKTKAFTKVEFIIILLISVGITMPFLGGLYGHQEEFLREHYSLNRSHIDYEDVSTFLSYREKSTLAYSEKLQDSKEECEKYAKLLQRKTIIDSQLFRLNVPETFVFNWCLVGCLLSLAAAYFLYRKTIRQS